MLFLFVVDATALFSVLIGKSSSSNILFIEEIEWFSPEFLKEELKEHKEEIMAKSSLKENDFNAFIELVFSQIKIVHEDVFRDKRELAKSLISDPDDTEYLALSLALNKYPIWSNDPHFKEQSAVQVFTTDELVKFLKTKNLF